MKKANRRTEAKTEEKLYTEVSFEEKPQTLFFIGADIGYAKTITLTYSN